MDPPATASPGHDRERTRATCGHREIERTYDLMHDDDPESTTAWMASGNCRNYPPAAFFPSDGVGVDRARKICAVPGQHDCLEYALENRIEHGVWGGCSERERRRILKRRRDALVVPTDRVDDGLADRGSSARRLSTAGGAATSAWPAACSSTCGGAYLRAGGVVASSSFVPRPSPSLNSFWALPRFLASFGAATPEEHQDHDEDDDSGLARIRTCPQPIRRRRGECAAGARVRRRWCCGATWARWRRRRGAHARRARPRCRTSRRSAARTRGSAAHHAAAADLLGLPRRRATLGEEQIGVDAQTVGLVVPSIGSTGTALTVMSRW